MAGSYNPSWIGDLITPGEITLENCDEELFCITCGSVFVQHDDTHFDHSLTTNQSFIDKRRRYRQNIVSLVKFLLFAEEEFSFPRSFRDKLNTIISDIDDLNPNIVVDQVAAITASLDKLIWTIIQQRPVDNPARIYSGFFFKKLAPHRRSSKDERMDLVGFHFDNGAIHPAKIHVAHRNSIGHSLEIRDAGLLDFQLPDTIYYGMITVRYKVNTSAVLFATTLFEVRVFVEDGAFGFGFSVNPTFVSHFTTEDHRAHPTEWINLTVRYFKDRICIYIELTLWATLYLTTYKNPCWVRIGRSFDGHESIKDGSLFVDHILYQYAPLNFQQQLAAIVF